MVQGKWLVSQMWAHYINKNHPLLDYSIIAVGMLHHAASYDLTLQHLYLRGKVNDEGVYHHFLTGNNMSTLHCYQVHKKGEARNGHRFNTGFFWSKCLYNTFTQKLGLGAHFKALMAKVIPNMMGPKTLTSNMVAMVVIGKWTIPMWKLLIFLGIMHRKDLFPRVTSRML